ncbi:MAG: tRNA (N(6)-L-threonylcarbamoyladenosine(37)-C(2))-methylthiotransferase MtaB [Clostridia bacterium]
MKAAYITLGCKVNQYDTDAMRVIMEKNGFETVNFDEIADVYIINTCSVTQTSDKKSRQMISRAHAKNARACIVVSGCYAKLRRKEVEELDGVNIVLGTDDRADIFSRVSSYLNGVQEEKNEHGARFEDLTAHSYDRARAYLKIEDGCDRFCTYCVIPYARGEIKSRSLQSVERELIRLSGMGYKEIVLTGIHIMSYGKDMCDGTNINDVIKMAGEIGIERIRLGSLEPEFCNENFVSAVRNANNVCAQFHLSLQSGSDSTLKRMNRRYTTDGYRKAVRLLRKNIDDAAITTDIIVGFAGETEEEYRETLSFAEEIGFSRIHVFPYSRRSGTRAYDFPNQILKSVKEERARELIALSHELSLKFNKNMLQKTAKVLFESEENGIFHGYTENYVEVFLKSNRDITGEILEVKLEQLYRDGILGAC